MPIMELLNKVNVFVLIIGILYIIAGIQELIKHHSCMGTLYLCYGIACFAMMSIKC